MLNNIVTLIVFFHVFYCWYSGYSFLSFSFISQGYFIQNTQHIIFLSCSVSTILLTCFIFRKEAGSNMVHFIKRLRELVPNIIISQPTYGYPQVNIKNTLISSDFKYNGNPSKKSKNYQKNLVLLSNALKMQSKYLHLYLL